MTYNWEKVIGAALLVAGVMLVGIVVAGIFGLVSGLVFWFCWNLGVVHFIAAVGGQVGHLSYWTAYFTIWFITAVGGAAKGITMSTT